MRVLFVNWHDGRHPRAGGAEVHLHRLAAALGDHGWTSTVLACGWRGAPAAERVEGVDVVRVGDRLTFPLAARRFFRDRAVVRGFDVVVEDLNKLPLLVHRWSDRPTLLLAHHLFGRVATHATWPPLGAFTWLAERVRVRRYRAVPGVAVSESTADDLVRHGLEPHRISVIHNAVDPAWMDHVGVTARDATPLFVVVGRLVRYKRVDLVLTALARLHAAGAPARLVIVGRGPAERGLRALTERLGLTASVTFTGYVTEDAKRALYGRAWANVLASEKEGWGLTIMEAAAQGTPTMAMACAGVRDAVQQHHSGVLVPPGDAVALADALLALIRDPTLVERYGEAAHREACRMTAAAAGAAFAAALVATHAGAPLPAAGRFQRFRPLDPFVEVARPLDPATQLFGVSRFIADGTTTAGRWEAVATLGAEDPRGHRPVLTIERACAGRVRIPLRGWPIDPVAGVAEMVTEYVEAGPHDLLGPIRVQRAGAPHSSDRPLR